MSAVSIPLGLLFALVPLAIAGVVLYLAIRFGVSHALRDDRRRAAISPPTTRPHETD